MTEISNTTAILTNLSTDSGNQGIWRIFDVSYYWYSLIAMIIVFALGTFVSMMTRGYKKKDVDEGLYYSGVAKIMNRKVFEVFFR